MGGFLCISRKERERVRLRVEMPLGQPPLDIWVAVSEIRGGTVRLAIKADPAIVAIDREERLAEGERLQEQEGKQEGRQ